MTSKVGIIPHRPGKPTPSLWDIGTCKQRLVSKYLLYFENLLTMPTSTATAERSFNVLKRAKTYILSTMGQERLSALALLPPYSQTHSASSRRQV